jgi:hypothetical protein
MNGGVPQAHESPLNDSLAVRRPSVLQTAGERHRVPMGSLSTLIFASSAAGATGIVSMGAAASFSAVHRSTVTDADSTTTFGDLGPRPGLSMLGAPYVLGQTHVHNAVAIPVNDAPAIPYNSPACGPGDSSVGAGGPGQIALHTDNYLGGVPDAIASPGCIRLATASVDWLASESPGAPAIYAL